MYPTWVLHNLVSQDRKELQGLQYGALVLESARFVLADPTYSMKRVCDKKSPEHELFYKDDMKTTVHLWAGALKPKDMAIYSAR